MGKHRRAILLAVLLCCLSVLAMTGIYRRETELKKEVDDLVELSEREDTDEEADGPATDNFTTKQSAGIASQWTADPQTEAPASTAAPAVVSAEAAQPDGGIEQSDAEESASGESAPDEGQEAVSQTVLSNAVSFTEENLLLWPVQGEVLIEFSMDATTYFPTLDQYKYNPGMVIQSEEGIPVYAGADANVLETGSTDELGTTVTLDIGGGYQVLYGQLKDLAVKPGDYIAAGGVLGYVAAPTKYYSLEGDNVYMEVTRDGESVDPLNYLE